MRTQTRVQELNILTFWLEINSVDLLQDKVYIFRSCYSTKMTFINNKYTLHPLRTRSSQDSKHSISRKSYLWLVMRFGQDALVMACAVLIALYCGASEIVLFIIVTTTIIIIIINNKHQQQQHNHHRPKMRATQSEEIVIAEPLFTTSDMAEVKLLNLNHSINIEMMLHVKA